MNPHVLSNKVLKRILNFADQAEVLFFPPFTPKEILNHYKGKVKEVPLIVRKSISEVNLKEQNKFKILIMDSGTGLLSGQIRSALRKIHGLDDIRFYVSSAYQNEAGNITFIDKNTLFLDYIPQMDLVVGRAGFNTISECIASRTPMLLISEEMNPELHENMMNIKQLGVGSFISLVQFANHLDTCIPRFIDNEYNAIKENMESHEIKADGARVIAEDILNSLGA